MGFIDVGQCSILGSMGVDVFFLKFFLPYTCINIFLTAFYLMNESTK